MQTLKWILVLVVLSMVPAFATSGQSGDLPFQHTACADGVDLSGQTITLYHLINPDDQPDTVYNPIHAGYSDAADYFNAHGGICGATVTPGYVDQWQGVLPAYTEVKKKDPKPVLITLYGSGDGEDMLSLLAYDKIPALNLRAGSTASVYGRDSRTLGWEFLTNPLYGDQVGAMCDYIAANPDRFPKPVIGFLNFDDGWAMGASNEALGYCESLGIGYAAMTVFNNDTTYVQPQIQKLIDAGATIIYTNSHENGPTTIAKGLDAMGLTGKVTLAVVNRGMDAYVAFSGEKDLDANGVPVISGMIGSVPIRTYAEQENPGIHLITEQADQHQRPLTMRTDGYILAWGATDLSIETYIQTGNRVGFDHVTGADIKETLEKLVYTPLGGVEQIDYQSGTRRATTADRIGVMQYLGQDDKTAASATNPPLIVTDGDQQHLVPLITLLTDFAPAPDLRPGGADVPAPSAAPTETTPTLIPVTHAATNSAGRIVFEGRPEGTGDDSAEIYVMNADGSGVTRMTDNHNFDGQPIWSPDGSKIVFVSDRDGNTEIYEMNADGSSPTNLSNSPAFEELPAWSPDGSKIAFGSERDGAGEIYLMNADGTDQTNLTHNPAFDGFPSFSPDRTKIAFTSNHAGHDEIYTMNIDGTEVTALTENTQGDNDFPLWSPDGTKLLFNSNRDGDMDVYVMNADGSNLVNVTNDQADEEKASWSPDGSEILFTSNQSGNWDMYTIKVDGSDLTNLTPDSPLKEGWASWKPSE